MRPPGTFKLILVFAESVAAPLFADRANGLNPGRPLSAAASRRADPSVARSGGSLEMDGGRCRISKADGRRQTPAQPFRARARRGFSSMRKYFNACSPSRDCSGPPQPTQANAASGVGGASTGTTRYWASQFGHWNLVASVMGVLIADRGNWQKRNGQNQKGSNEKRHANFKPHRLRGPAQAGAAERFFGLATAPLMKEAANCGGLCRHAAVCSGFASMSSSTSCAIARS